MTYESSNGDPLQEGVYLVDFGGLVHVKKAKDSWVYSHYPSDPTSYVSLDNEEEAKTLLLGRIADPRISAGFLEKFLAQPQSSRTPEPNNPPHCGGCHSRGG